MNKEKNKLGMGLGALLNNQNQNKNSINKMKYSSLALNKRVKDDPEMLAMVDNAIEMCSTLNLNPPKKEHNHSHSSKKDSKKNKRSKFSKPPKANIRP